MFQWAISLFITISPCPVSHGPDPNIVSGPWDSSHQSDMHIAHWALDSVEFLSFDIVTIFREGDNLFYGQIKALVAVVEILGCKILRTHQSIDVKMRTPSL